MSAFNSHTEEELLLHIANGDENAFATLFEQFHPRLFHYILSLIHSKEVAEELVLDVFLKLWQGRDIIPEIKNMDGFLFKIAYHKSIDFLRAAKRNPRLANLAWEQLQLSDEADPAVKLLSQEYDQLLRETILLLPAQRRRVYEMNREEGKSYREIADELAISPNTVNMHLYEARQFIRSHLLKRLDTSFLLIVFLYELI